MSNWELKDLAEMLCCLADDAAEYNVPLKPWITCGCRHELYMDERELKHLAEMLWYADQAYEGESEKTLSQRLSKKGLINV